MAGKGEGGSHPRMSAGYSAGSQGQSHEEHKGAKESAQEMMSHLRESAGQGVEKAREAAEHLQEKSRDFVSSAADQAQEAWRRGSDGLRRRLVASFQSGGRYLGGCRRLRSALSHRLVGRCVRPGLPGQRRNRGHGQSLKRPNGSYVALQFLTSVSG